jgi:hypothetical protein
MSPASCRTTIGLVRGLVFGQSHFVLHMQSEAVQSIHVKFPARPGHERISRPVRSPRRFLEEVHPLILNPLANFSNDPVHVTVTNFIDSASHNYNQATKFCLQAISNLILRGTLVFYDGYHKLKASGLVSYHTASSEAKSFHNIFILSMTAFMATPSTFERIYKLL